MRQRESELLFTLYHCFAIVIISVYIRILIANEKKCSLQVFNSHVCNELMLHILNKLQIFVQLIIQFEVCLHIE